MVASLLRCQLHKKGIKTFKRSGRSFILRKDINAAFNVIAKESITNRIRNLYEDYEHEKKWAIEPFLDILYEDLNMDYNVSDNFEKSVEEQNQKQLPESTKRMLVDINEFLVDNHKNTLEKANRFREGLQSGGLD